jgi:hypothetical protein
MLSIAISAIDSSDGNGRSMISPAACRQRDLQSGGDQESQEAAPQPLNATQCSRGMSPGCWDESPDRSGGSAWVDVGDAGGG